MKTGTRRYAKRQTSWIRNQLLPAVRQAQARGEHVHLYLLDATDPALWDANVREPAEAITRAFLRGEPLPDPRSLSTAAATHLAPLLASAAPDAGRIERNRLYACPECTQDPERPFLVRESERGRHQSSRTHRYAVKRRTRQAWIAERQREGAGRRAERQAAAEAEAAEAEAAPSAPSEPTSGSSSE